MPERDKIDELIDSALASYAEPHVGLEQRMVARMAVGEDRSLWRRWWMVALGAPVVAAVILLIHMTPGAPHSRASSPVASTPTVPVVQRGAVAPAVHIIASSGTSRRIRYRDHDVDEETSNVVLRPKRNIFPTLQPMTAEEQALSRFAAEASEADRKGIVEAPRRVDEPLNISAISIAPLPSLEDKQN